MNENNRFKNCNECMFFAEVERDRGKECTFNGFDADDYEIQYFENYCCAYKKDGEIKK